MLHFGAVDYEARGLGQRPAGRRARRRPHAVFAPTSPARSTPTGRQTVTVHVEDDPHDLAKPRGKQDWQLEPHSIWYPRTTGIWQTVWLERVPRHLHPEAALDAASSRASRSAAKSFVDGDAVRRPVGRSQDLARRQAAGRRPLQGASATRRTARSRCPTPASTTRATSCCGAPSGRPCSTPSVTLRHGGAGARRGALVHGAALGGDQRATASCSTAARITLRLVLDQGYWPDTLHDRAVRRRAAARRRAGQGDGLQRRAQAPEDRRPALPVLGRQAGPAGVGRDALGLPLQPAGHHPHGARMDRSDRARLQPSRASSSGCRSTNPGACRT